jgi:2-dehydropantoate 2-reductase
MRILVVGAGSTGGYFGGRLAEAGRDVTFLVRPARAKNLRANGLEIKSPHGNVTLKPQLVTAGSIDNAFDVVLLTVTALSLDAALDDLAPAVGPHTMILPVLNGMKHIDALIARFGAKAVIGCVCKVATTVDDQGRIVQLSKLQDFSYGEMDGTRSARIDELDAFMQGAGFDARLSLAIEREMWEKWILLAALGGVTCLMRGNIGEIATAPGGADFTIGLLNECVAIVQAAGHTPSEAFVTGTRMLLTKKDSSQTSSLYRDLENNRPVEVDHILGDLLARGRSFTISAPLLAAAFTHLSLYQSRISA